MRPQRIDANQIYERLHCVVRYGVRANRLFEHGRPLIDLLIPSDDTSDECYSHRAILAEEVIRRGIERENRTDAAALRITLSVDGDSSVLKKLETRRREAARIYGVTPNTYRMNHERALLHDLAFQILAIILREEFRPQADEYPDDCGHDSPETAS
ncbi:hypothetical protein [Actinomadura rupiterrae]|uniref:hypothetical protein n=1 Tax=Actinomadura rupiterrae TaxID=559627 RepID=UPI0020A4E3DD|nr:hypothetical protein [Actinomadura rupiterrae]MCP2341622.1 hypothetical protein [Actinomadura rupiterrae]